MEEKYPELKNLMPRDVVSREMYFIREKYGQVYLDMTGIDKSVLDKKLPDLCEEIKYYLGIDPSKEPVPVKEGIHYFMGGINCDMYHHTNKGHLYAAGECTSLYHGANRLGGNSLLGAVYGGYRAAKTALLEAPAFSGAKSSETADGGIIRKEFLKNISSALCESLSVARDNDGLLGGLSRIENQTAASRKEKQMKLFAQAIVMSALYRKESRGAHYRSDHPYSDDNNRHMTMASYLGEEVKISYGR